MSINLPVPIDIQPRSLSQLLSDILRRASDATVTKSTIIVTGASGSKYTVGVDTDGALTVTAGAVGAADTNGVILTASDGTKYRLGVANDGAITVDTASTGIVLTSPNGTQYLLGVDTNEALTTVPL